MKTKSELIRENLSLQKNIFILFILCCLFLSSFIIYKTKYDRFFSTYKSNLDVALRINKYTKDIYVYKEKNGNINFVVYTVKQKEDNERNS